MSERTRRLAPDRVVRLDLTGNPFGPCASALEAASGSESISPHILELKLRQRLSEMHRTPVDSLWLVPGADAAIRQLVGGTDGCLVAFPPGAASSLVAREWPGRKRVSIARGVGCHSRLEPEEVSDIPGDSVVLVDSPSDPLGTLLAPIDAVRLARAGRRLIVDERYSEFSGQTLLNLASEFENIIVVRSFESWAGLADFPCAWVVCPPAMAQKIGLDAIGPRPEATAAAVATLSHLGPTRATVRLMQEERSRLYRQLRKFSFIEPVPSWGPFVVARIVSDCRDQFLSGLCDHGIRVHAPTEAGLERFVRIGIGTRSEMERLRSALLELAPRLVA